MNLEEIDRLCDQFESELKIGQASTPLEFCQRENLEHDIRLMKELELVAASFARLNEEPESTAALPDSHRMNEMIGQYKLLQQIGEGGMGTVYMAEQKKPIERRVALKVIKPGMGSKEVIARFESERQALAMMDHENIAKMFDAGTTDDGRPYFVMELVRGVPLTKFCDNNKLSIKERLELFVTVCQAVQHAHQKGIIHRDIKPSNVLVSNYDGRAVPKIIDFGVAKATQQKLTDKTLFTEFGRVIGTIQYMSPEQAGLSHLDIDTRSDIYSLGVLLYELMTGFTPIDKKSIREAGWERIMQLIREQQPKKPSTKISESGEALKNISALRRSSSTSLGSALRGDLDWIVMKALEKDRSRRYENATQLAEDLKNHLTNRPVIARPPTRFYLFKKWVGRNRATAVTLCSAFGVIVVIAGILWWKNNQLATALHETQRAEGEYSVINSFLIDNLLGQANPDLNPYQEQTTVVELLNRASAEIEDSKLFEKQPEIEATIRLAIGKTFFSLGKWFDAKQHLVRAYALREHNLGLRAPKTLEALDALAEVQVKLEENDDGFDSVAKLQKYWPLAQAEATEAVIAAQLKQCQLLRNTGQYAEAEALIHEVQKSCERTLNGSLLHIKARQENATLLAAQHKNYDLAKSLFQQNLSALKDLGEGENSTLYLNTLDSFAQLQLDYGLGKESEKNFADVLKRRLQVLPTNHPAAIDARIGLGFAQMNLGKFDLASDNFRTAHKQALESLGEHHEVTWRAQHAIVRLMSRNVFLSPNRMEVANEAKQMAESMILTCDQKNWPLQHLNRHQSMIDLAMTLTAVGMLKKGESVLGMPGNPPELSQALELLKDVYELSKKARGSNNALTIGAGMQRLQVQRMMGEENSDAQKLVNELRDASLELPPGIPIRAFLSQFLGRLLVQTKPSEAEVYFREHFNIFGQKMAVSEIERQNSLRLLLDCLRLQGKEKNLGTVQMEKNQVYFVKIIGASLAPIVGIKLSMRSQTGPDSRQNLDSNGSHMFFLPKRSREYVLAGMALSENVDFAPQGLEIRLCEQVSHEVIDGKIDANSERDHLVNNFPCDSHSIEMKTGRWYRIAASSSSMPLIMRLESESGHCARWNVDGKQNECSISFSPKENGKFKVVVMPTNKADEGGFALSVSEFKPTDEKIEIELAGE